MNKTSDAPSVSDIGPAPLDLPPQQGPASLTESSRSPEYFSQLMNEFSRVTTENGRLKDEMSQLKSQNVTRAILDDLIKPYAKYAFNFMSVYCGVVSIFLILSGWNIWGFYAPESVLQLLVGSTAVTVIGLVGMVLTGVFVGARK